MASKYNHRKYYSAMENRKQVGKFSISTGMIITFNYTGYDKKPLVLVLMREAVKGGASGLMHCLNLNYMYESRIQFVAKLINKHVTLDETKESFNKEMKNKNFN